MIRGIKQVLTKLAFAHALPGTFIMMRNSLTEKDETIADLNGQLQTSVPSSAVSSLKNKIQEQADEIVSLNAYIRKMNSADLIAKENERLKRRKQQNRKRSRGSR